MREVFPIKENDKERIINDLKTTKFACIRYGLRDIETITTKDYTDGINVQVSCENIRSRNS